MLTLNWQGDCLPVFNMFHTLNDVNDFAGLYQAVYDELWLHQKYMDALEKALGLYEQEIKT